MSGRMIVEPIDPPLAPPRAGWPGVLLRLESASAELTRNQVAYDLASVSRRWRIGVVAKVEGFDMVVFPHLTVEQAVRGWATMRDMARSPDLRSMADVGEGA